MVNLLEYHWLSREAQRPYPLPNWKMFMKRLIVLFVLCASALAAPVARAQGEGVGFVEITPEARAAIDSGLAFLARTQNDDGSWTSPRYGRHVGVTSLACLAFMADGHLPGRSEYGDHVARGLSFVLQNSTESGLIAADTSHGPMYGHGFATLFLGEIYGMTGDDRVREPLAKAVRLIVRTQNQEGGWRYNPVPYDADLSVTICQVKALRSARNAGISVPKETIDRAIQYVRKCQDPSDGGFRYMIGMGPSAFPRSAAGVAALFYAGSYGDPALDRGLKYLDREAVRHVRGGSGHYFYGHYYAAQALFIAGGEHWAGYFPKVRDEYVSRQQEDGRWDAQHGDAYGTAMSLLVLEMPNRLLPIFQK